MVFVRSQCYIWYNVGVKSKRSVYIVSNNNYDADSIKILSDIDHIRLRSGMYIGNNSDTSPIFNECIDNSVDEVMAGYSTSIS